MKSTLMSLALLGQAAAFPAIRGVFAPEDVNEAKEMFRRSYIQQPDEAYPVDEEPVYPTHEAPTYPVVEPPVYPTGGHPTGGSPSGGHPTGGYPTGGVPHPPYPTGTSPNPPVYPTGTAPQPPIYPTGTGNPQPPNSYPPVPPNSYPHVPPPYTNTVTSGSEYITYTTTGYTNVETVSTGFEPTSTSVTEEGDKTYYSTYLTPTYSTGYVQSTTTGYEVHVPVTEGCPAAYPTTIYKTETVYVSAGPAVTPGPDSETYTVTDKYGSTKTIVIPGTTYEPQPPIYTSESSEEVSTQTYTVVPVPSDSATHLPPVYPTHPTYPVPPVHPTGTGPVYPTGTGPVYPTGIGSTGVVPYPTGDASYYKPEPKPEPTQDYSYGYRTEPEPTKAWYALF